MFYFLKSIFKVLLVSNNVDHINDTEFENFNVFLIINKIHNNIVPTRIKTVLNQTDSKFFSENLMFLTFL